jgi:hypothetical protein
VKSIDLRVGEVCCVLEPDVARVLQFRAVLPLGPADLVDGVVDDRHGMELVEGDLGKVLGGALDEGLAHVDADFRDSSRVAAMGGEIGGERRDLSLPANRTRRLSRSANRVT